MRRLACVFLAGCSLLMLNCAKPEIDRYGPRWIDYKEWGEIKALMTQDELFELLGEPNSVVEGLVSDTATVITYAYKLRIKHFPVQKFGPSSTRSGSQELVDVKPPKKATYVNNWGETLDLYCVLVNDRLVQWYVLQLKENKEVIQERGALKFEPEKQ